MSHERRHGHGRACVLAIALVLLACVPGAWAQEAAKPPAAEPKPSMTIYGFAMLDFGANFKSISPDWYDTMRITKLPSYADQYGKDGSWFAQLYRLCAENCHVSLLLPCVCLRFTKVLSGRMILKEQSRQKYMLPIVIEVLVAEGQLPRA